MNLQSADALCQHVELSIRGERWTKTMNAYQLPKLILMWEHEKITPEQCIGQLLVHIFNQQAKMEQLDNRLAQMSRTASATDGNGGQVKRHSAKRNM